MLFPTILLVLGSRVAATACSGSGCSGNGPMQDDVALLQYRHIVDSSANEKDASLKLKNCGDAPVLDGTKLDDLISNNKEALIIAIEDMKCTQAALSAFSGKGVTPVTKFFTAPFQYSSGASPVWDWLHCSYQPDAQGGTTMHSYVFVGSTFAGQGFDAAQKITAGDFDNDLTTKTCDDQFAEQAAVVKAYMEKPEAKVLLFGWNGCPCTGIAQSRMFANSVCFDGRTWSNPDSKLMKYFQCKESDPSSHSFIYFKLASGWKFQGNGFAFADSAMPDNKLDDLLTDSAANKSCEHATVAKNVFGEVLEECRSDVTDMSGSWMDDGKCSETSGGIHQICLEHLPADFSSETRQSAWSEGRANQRHCVCIGAWSLYMTESENHVAGASAVMPRCQSIPETALTEDYVAHWKDWNGVPAKFKVGIKELVSRCLLTPNITHDQECGLKERWEKLVADEGADFQNAPEFESLTSTFSGMTCPGT